MWITRLPLAALGIYPRYKCALECTLINCGKNSSSTMGYTADMTYRFRAPVRAVGVRRRTVSAPGIHSGGSMMDAAMELARVRQEMIDNEAKRAQEHTKNEAARAAAHEEKMKELDAVIERGTNKINNLRVPAKGDPGKHADEKAIEERVLARIPVPKDGESPDAKDVAQIVTDMLAAEKEDPIDAQDIVEQVIGEITKKKILKPDHIDGLSKNLQQFASQLKPGMGYVHGGGITRLTAGTNITIVKLTDGSYRITAAGGGFTALTATETPNGVRTVFTFAGASAQPTYMRVDGTLTKATSASGTVNWTWNAGLKQATLVIPAQDDIDGIV